MIEKQKIWNMKFIKKLQYITVGILLHKCEFGCKSKNTMKLGFRDNWFYFIILILLRNENGFFESHQSYAGFLKIYVSVKTTIKIVVWDIMMYIILPNHI